VSRIEGGGFGGLAEQARLALEAQARAQIEAQREAAIERTRNLAETAARSLESQTADGPQGLGCALAEVQAMPVEARSSFAAEVARRSSLAGSMSGDPGRILQALVDSSCPPGGERRKDLGRALLGSVVADVSQLPEPVIEAAIVQALASLKAGPGRSVPSSASPGTPRDVLERSPRPLGVPSRPAAIARMRSLATDPTSSATDATITPPAAAVGPPLAATVPRMDLPPPTSRPSRVETRQTLRAPVERGSATSDAEVLRAALGDTVHEVSAPSLISGPPSPLRTSLPNLVGVPTIEWAQTVPALIQEPLGRAASGLQTVVNRMNAVRMGVVDAEGGTLAQKVKLAQAGGLLTKSAFHAGTALTLLGPTPTRTPREALQAITAARSELREARRFGSDALETLGELRGRFHGLDGSLTELRTLDRLSLESQRALEATGARAAILEGLDAGAGLLTTPGIGPDESVASSSLLTEDDLARIGSGLDPGQPPAQIAWTEELVNTFTELGRQQGGVTDADGARHLELARTVLQGSAESVPGLRPFEATDLAAALKLSGIPLEKVDPNQLVSAAAYVSASSNASDQEDRLRKALDNFKTLTTVGLPKLTRQQMVDQLWAMAKVPGHALQKLSDSEIQKKYQEVLVFRSIDRV
jgi:hypothetical protein